MKTEGKVQGKFVHLYGFNTLKEFLHTLPRLQKSGFGAGDVIVKITKEAGGRAEVMSLLQKHKVQASIVTREEIEHATHKGAVHQGILLTLPEGLLYTDYALFLEEEKQKKKSLVVLLDELEDPHNVGAIIRSAVSFGASGILLPEHGQTSITGTVVKTASGMNFLLPICCIGNVNTELTKLKKEGYWIYGLDGEGKENITKTTFDNKTVLVVGAEGKGIREKTKELCDFVVSIPIDVKADSLNASVAASIALYEWKRQGN